MARRIFEIESNKDFEEFIKRYKKLRHSRNNSSLDYDEYFRFIEGDINIHPTIILNYLKQNYNGGLRCINTALKRLIKKSVIEKLSSEDIWSFNIRFTNIYSVMASFCGVLDVEIPDSLESDKARHDVFLLHLALNYKETTKLCYADE